MRLPVLATALLAALPALAQVPSTIAHEGRILRADGSPERGSVTLTFALYTTASGGTPAWSETQALTLSAAGYYALLLGAQTPLPAFDRQYWLGVMLAGEPEMSPRAQLAAAPYALRAAVAEQLRGRSGTTKPLAGTSCKQIVDDGFSTGDGLYWIDPNGGDSADAVNARCDMTTAGGGWTRVFVVTLGTVCGAMSASAQNDPASTSATCAKYSDAAINQIARERVFYTRYNSNAPLFTKYDGQLGTGGDRSFSGAPTRLINGQPYSAIQDATPLYPPEYGGHTLFAQQNWYATERCLGAPPGSWRLSLEYIRTASTKYVCSGACNADCPTQVATGLVEVYLR